MSRRPGLATRMRNLPVEVRRHGQRDVLLPELPARLRLTAVERDLTLAEKVAREVG
jgi:hypothetical protein